jgi:hypothetical protein
VCTGEGRSKDFSAVLQVGMLDLNAAGSEFRAACLEGSRVIARI